MKKSIIKAVGIVALLISSQFLFAQAPGFLGKRASIYYNYSASPGILGNAIPYNYSKKKQKGIVNYIRGYHQATFEYAISRNRSLNLHYFIHRGGYGKSTENLTENRDSISRNYRTQSIAISTKKYRVRLNGNRVDNSGIAPLGIYLESKFFITFLNDEQKRTNNTIISEKKRMYYGGSLTFGRHLVFDKVILNFGMELGYIHQDKRDKEEYWDFTIAIEPEIPISSYGEIARHHLLGFHVGIGYPLF